jgi:hypothetical protein
MNWNNGRNSVESLFGLWWVDFALAAATSGTNNSLTFYGIIGRKSINVVANPSTMSFSNAIALTMIPNPAAGP